MGLACSRFLTVLHNSVLWLVSPLALLDNSHIKLSKNCRVWQNTTKLKCFTSRGTHVNNTILYLLASLAWRHRENSQQNTLASTSVTKHDITRSKNHLYIYILQTEAISAVISSKICC